MHLAYAYAESAKRLASTRGGRPEDDLILLPYLQLMRHAYEVQMKALCQQFAAWTREGFGSEVLDEGQVDEQALNKRLRREYRHDLDAVLRELQEQYAGMEPSESFPEVVAEVVRALHAADGSGTALRYTGSLGAEQESLDFPRLVTWLEEGFGILEVLADPLDYRVGIQREIAAEREVRMWKQ